MRVLSCEGEFLLPSSSRDFFIDFVSLCVQERSSSAFALARLLLLSRCAFVRGWRLCLRKCVVRVRS